MGLGSSCVRDCERTAHEYAGEDCLPGPAGMPGLSSGSAPITGMPSPNGVKAGGMVSDGAVVPPVPNWFQVLNHSDGGQKESARFDEVTSTPHTGVGTLDQITPRGTPGSQDGLATGRASPRESPRPADERKDDPNTARGEGLGKSDEISYEGGYLGSMKHGTGRLRMSGCTYEGDFLNDMKHGNGTLSWDDGRQYRGQFDSGKFHGSAVMTWPDGRKYCGQYIEDRKHGEGTFSWQDGRRYQGQWVVGKRHGVGVYTNAKGLTRTGMWQMDRPLHWDVAQAPPPSGTRPAGDSEASPAPSNKAEPTLPKVSGRPRPLSPDMADSADD